MAIDFYYHPIAPTCRSAAMTAGLLGVKLNIKFLDIFNKEQFTPEYLKLNPAHGIPVMVDDGFVINDSHAIMTYLCDKYDKTGKYYPKDLKKRTMVDQYLHFDSSKLFPAFSDAVIPVIRKTLKWPPKEAIEKLQERIKTIENFLEDKQYMIGDEVTIADISILSNICSAELFDLDISAYPNLSGWMGRMKKLPNFKEHHEDFRDMAKKIFFSE